MPWTSQGSRMVVALVDRTASSATSTGGKGMIATGLCFATRLTRSRLTVPAGNIPDSRSASFIACSLCVYEKYMVEAASSIAADGQKVIYRII